jgi:hypothetical protein
MGLLRYQWNCARGAGANTESGNTAMVYRFLLDVGELRKGDGARDVVQDDERQSAMAQAHNGIDFGAVLATVTASARRSQLPGRILAVR